MIYQLLIKISSYCFHRHLVSIMRMRFYHVIHHTHTHTHILNTRCVQKQAHELHFLKTCSVMTDLKTGALGSENCTSLRFLTGADLWIEKYACVCVCVSIHILSSWASQCPNGVLLLPLGTQVFLCFDVQLSTKKTASHYMTAKWKSFVNSPFSSHSHSSFPSVALFSYQFWFRNTVYVREISIKAIRCSQRGLIDTNLVENWHQRWEKTKLQQNWDDLFLDSLTDRPALNTKWATFTSYFLPHHFGLSLYVKGLKKTIKKCD